MQNQRLDLYATFEQRKLIKKAADKYEMSMSKFAIYCIEDTLRSSRGRKRLRRLGDCLMNERLERDAKESERDSGDFLGSLDKRNGKIREIKSKYKKGMISHKIYVALMRQTIHNYAKTSKIKEERLLKRWGK